MAMRRRAFVAGLGGAAVAWSRSSKGQSAGHLHRIGFLGLASLATQGDRVDALRAGLHDLGYMEGRDIEIDYRWAEGNYDHLSELAGELIRLNVSLIVTHAQGVRAAQAVTSTIPIVMASVGDAVASGLVANLAHPGGNVTGMTILSPDLMVKRLELLKEILPSSASLAVLLYRDNLVNEPVRRSIEAAATEMKVKLRPIEVDGPEKFDATFAALNYDGVGGVVIQDDPVFIAHSKVIADLALRRQIATSGFNDLAAAGGTIAYGVNFVAMYRAAARFVDKILKGAKPGDLPVEQPTTFSITINIRTARALGLSIPPMLLARADEVIE
jgi:putative tryptophan/tyrosine transport system substrate-binding protein